MEPEIESLLDFVNGKGISSDKLLLLITTGYLQLSQKALAKLKELEGAVHALNTEI